MEINISTGLVRIAVNVDGKNNKYIEFNPNDVLFIEKLHRFYKIVLERASEWQRISPSIEARIKEIGLDENGMPISIEPALQPLYDMNTFMKKQIDEVFGEGTSQDIFGDLVTRDPSIYAQLIQGIQNYLQPLRKVKVERYTNTATRKPRARKKSK